MRIGLFFGTYNPIHIGHLIIANHLVEFSNLDQVWLVVTPHSPFKKKQSLLDDYQRLELVHLATKDYDHLRPSDIEFKLPQPNYTVNTLVHLQEKFPEHQFALIMGEDNLKSLHKWKNYEVILEDYEVFVYPRLSSGGLPEQFKNHKNIHRVEAPIIELSATFIRNAIKDKKNVRPMLPEAVWAYVDRMGLYL
jgi:nicotinate-nucleotide adenylyltransferase